MLPGNKATWDIQRLLIVNSCEESESESDDDMASEMEDSPTNDTPTTDSPELSDISKLLLKAKATAEVGVV